MSKKISRIMHVSLITVLLTTPLFGYDMEAKLKELKIVYEKTEKDNPFLVAIIGETKVLVMKDAVRNQDNQVIRAVMGVLPPIILTEKHLQKLIKANSGRKPSQGIWGIFGENEQHQIIYYEIDIPENASDTQLTNAIIQCSKIQFPFPYDLQQQYVSAIRTVLEMDRAATQTSSDRKGVVQKMRKISLELCPVDFANAYRQHLRAWENSLDMSGAELGLTLGAIAGAGEKQDNLAGAIVLGLLGGAIGAGIQSSSQKESIDSTYYEVLRIARKYGVNQ